MTALKKGAEGLVKAMFETKQKILVSLAAVAALVAIFALQGVADKGMPPRGDVARAALSQKMDDVASRWPKLAHVAAAGVADKIGQDNLLLIDSRSTEEFAVSHLSGAEHVAPDTTAAEFLARFGDQIAGKDIVFYCAVGVRSSTLATRVASKLKAKGARSVANMSGGIFAWHNEKRPLINANGPTQSVHSYDAWWARMVARQEHIQNTP